MAIDRLGPVLGPKWCRWAALFWRPRVTIGWLGVRHCLAMLLYLQVSQDPVEFRLYHFVGNFDPVLGHQPLGSFLWKSWKSHQWEPPSSIIHKRVHFPSPSFPEGMQACFRIHRWFSVWFESPQHWAKTPDRIHWPSNHWRSFFCGGFGIVHS